MKVVPWKSPNFNDRENGEKPSVLVIHFTSMKSTVDALVRLSDPDHVPPVSCHYLIDEAGNIFTMVPEEKRAWHAGISSWQGRTDLNSASIGIEISNREYKPYTPEQLKTLVLLCKDIMHRHNIAPENVVGHSDIAPARKQDPGYHFPWKELAKHDIGVWPKPKLRDKFNAAAVAKNPQKLTKLFKKAGYDTGVHEDGTPSLDQVINAFQQRYEPHLFTNDNAKPGVATAETVALLRAVARINKKFQPKR